MTAPATPSAPGQAHAREPDGAGACGAHSLEVVHAVPGRLRVRVPRVSGDAGFAATIPALLVGQPGVLGVRVNRTAASVAVRYASTGSEAAMRALLSERIASRDGLRPAASARPSGDPAVVRTQGAEGPQPDDPPRRLGLPAALAGLAALGRLIGFALPMPLMAGAVAVAAAPIARRAARSLTVDRRLNIDVLDLTAITLTTLRGSFLTPAVMIGMVEIGEAIRERTARASQREVLDLLDSMAPVVWVERDGERHQVPIDDVARGDVIVVYPGDRIPVDGRVLDGTAYVDEHQLTGEPMPIACEEGQPVYASTLMRDGHLHIAVEQVGEETRAGRIVRLMRDAPVHDTRIENYAARLADRWVLPAFLLSAAALAVTRDPARAASILITDFTTGIRVSVPTTILAALTRAAQRGILIRSGRALEQLAGVDTVVFDKTGTVTRGHPIVTEVISVDPTLSPDRVLTLAVSAEQRLSHPVAEAVVGYAREHGIAPRRRAHWHYDIGLGVRAEVDGEPVLVGGDRLMRQEDVALDRFLAERPDLRHRGESVIYVASSGRLRGAMTYADPLRTESEKVISALRRSHGMEIHLLTGDRAQPAKAVARELGIPPANTHFELFPEDKAAVVRELHAAGRRVAFVGDGINDLPALAYADVSVSFGGASDVARETADVVLMDGDLRGLPGALTVARRALRLTRQNIGFVAGTNLSALGFATTRGLGPVAAAVIHNGSTVVAAVNGLRPLLDRDGVGHPALRAASSDPDEEKVDG